MSYLFPSFVFFFASSYSVFSLYSCFSVFSVSFVQYSILILTISAVNLFFVHELCFCCFIVDVSWVPLFQVRLVYKENRL